MEGHGGGPASPLEDCSLCPAMLPAPSSAPRFTTQQLVGASEICPIVSFLYSKLFHDLPNSAESKPKSCYSLQCPARPPGPGPPGFIPRCSPLSTLLQPRSSLWLLDLHKEHSRPATGPSHWPCLCFRHIAHTPYSFPPSRPWLSVTHS